MDEEKEKTLIKELYNVTKEVAIISKISKSVYTQIRQTLPRKRYKDIIDNAQVLSGLIEYCTYRIDKLFNESFPNAKSDLKPILKGLRRNSVNSSRLS